MIVQAFRHCEGFSKAEIAQFREVFTANDFDRSGEIEEEELGSLFRWLGTPWDFEAAKDLMEKIDMDRNGSVGFDEFLKVMQRLRESELEELQLIFETCDEDGSGSLDLQEVKFFLVTLGYTVTAEHMKSLKENFSENEATFAECMALVESFREEFRTNFSSADGFSAKEVDKLKDNFDKLDRRSSGVVSKRELEPLIAEMFPELVTKGKKEEIDKTLCRFGSDTGRISFTEYLRMMRMLTDQADHLSLSSQQTIAAEAGFSPAEVAEVRRIYKMLEQDSSRSHDYALLANFFPTTGIHLPRLLEKCGRDEDGRIDFREFSKIMRRLMDGEQSSEEGGDAEKDEDNEGDRIYEQFAQAKDGEYDEDSDTEEVFEESGSIDSSEADFTRAIRQQMKISDR
jgi:Ca2+-binding EF-hand superfamily protein